ncbi:hypothetical protein [Acetobacter sp. AAB5]|uniref:hypothetical protein n=1 Tax=Acetobacter sp. AAB5 TaxID=3418370 RepID=UPI003CF6A642
MNSTSAVDWKQSMMFETDVEDQPGIMPHVGQKTGGTCAFTTFQNGSSSFLIGRKKSDLKANRKNPEYEDNSPETELSSLSASHAINNTDRSALAA